MSGGQKKEEAGNMIRYALLLFKDFMQCSTFQFRLLTIVLIKVDIKCNVASNLG